MDGISILEASILYSVLISPLLSVVLLFFWMSANLKNTARTQLLGVVILLAVGFFFINSPVILIVEVTAIILLVIWIFAYKDLFLKGQLPVVLLIFALQSAYYILFFIFIGLEYKLAITLLCIIQILSMILLYPWAYGNKNNSKGRVFIIIAFIIQLIYAILNIVLSLMITSNL